MLVTTTMLAGCVAAAQAAEPLAVDQLRCEYRVDPLGLDEPAPRLSWVVASNRRGAAQTAWQVLVASSAEALAADRGDLWDSGKVATDQTCQIPYAGAPLTTFLRCWWKVRVWDEQGTVSAWSAPARWEMGLLQPADWIAQWIGHDSPPADAVIHEAKLVLPPAPYLRTTFDVTSPVRRATVFATALGLYELHLNGAKVGNECFRPGWTDYRKRINYQAYDVTGKLRAGGNALGLVLGDGWYSGYVGLGGRDRYGSHRRGRAQLVLELADGTRQVIGTDGSWKAAYGPIMQSDMLMGEYYDARRELAGWDAPGYDDSAWTPVVAEALQTAPLEGYRGVPIRVTEELPAKALTEPQPGAYVFDLGQNMVGWARLRVAAPAGTVVRLRFAEVLNPDGTLYVTNLRGARCIDHYVCRGGGVELWEPRFTFRGFRYVELTGLPAKPGLEAVTGIVAHSDTPRSGTFECSNPMLNQLQLNIVWGQRGNFVEVPTDCPQRDERLGWTGDAEAFCPTAAFNMDVAAFFAKWLQDLEDGQTPEGAFPDVAPFVAAGAGTAAWGDAGTICPWNIYLAYDDTRALARHYAAMTRWVEYLRTHSRDLVRPAEGYGDWLSINANTPQEVLATAYFAWSTHLTAEAARVLGKAEDAAKYDRLCDEVKAAFNRAFVHPDGRIHGDTQTCYVLALKMGLLSEENQRRALEYLGADLERRGGLSTGFVGTASLMPTLTAHGRTDLAWKLALNEQFPSWGFTIRHGATTIWERWDGWTPEHGFQDPGMNSFNHYAFGAVGEWLYRTVAGIGLDPSAPGYKRVIVHPEPGGGVTRAKAELQSIRGRIAVEWQIEGGRFTLRVTVPANCTALVYAPAASAAVVTESGRPAAESPGVRLERMEGGAAVFAIASGSYEFSAPQ